MIVTAKIEKLENGKLVLKPDVDISRFLAQKRPRRVEVRLDDGRTISADQRRKIFAIIRDISLWSGQEPEELRLYLEWDFCSRCLREWFSLSNCDMTTAREFITYLIQFCFHWGVPTKDSLLTQTDDIGKYLYLLASSWIGIYVKCFRSIKNRKGRWSVANDYIKLWVKDYRALLEPFNEAERGRILWAMMDYKETGSEPKFLGNERFVWAAIKAKIDASNEAYERQAAANRANGARGGRPRKSKENQENPENRMGFEESTTEENPEKSTGPPDDTPESYWVWAGCDSMLTPYMAAEFRDLRETGVEDALVVATLEEAMRHQAKHPWCYAKRLLDQAAAQHVTTFAEWEKTHIKNKGNRVDRETPSGNNILGLTDSLGRIKRRPFKKQDVPQGKGGDSNGE